MCSTLIKELGILSFAFADFFVHFQSPYFFLRNEIFSAYVLVWTWEKYAIRFFFKSYSALESEKISFCSVGSNRFLSLKLIIKLIDIAKFWVILRLVQLRNLAKIRLLFAIWHFELFKCFEPNFFALIRYKSFLLSNVWCIKFRSKHSTVLVLCLLRNLMHQTLCIQFII